MNDLEYANMKIKIYQLENRLDYLENMIKQILEK